VSSTLVLTVASGGSAAANDAQAVVISASAGIRIPPQGVTANNTAFKMSAGSAISSVQSGVATVPAASGVYLALTQVTAGALLAEGDQIALRPASADCFATRYVTDSSTETEGTFLDGNLSGSVNALGLAAG
ncbi:hypothetical protein T484DRAFT_1849047, partial [Baffinella frigidus]